MDGIFTAEKIGELLLHHKKCSRRAPDPLCALRSRDVVFVKKKPAQPSSGAKSAAKKAEAGDKTILGCVFLASCPGRDVSPHQCTTCRWSADTLDGL